MFGLFPADGEEIKNAVATAKAVFNYKVDQPGLPRYENDYYNRVSPDITGNWWPITSLWLAQYELEMGNTEATQHILDWIRSLMMPTGVLSEQINPYNESFVSVAPLTWSHAEYLSTMLDTITEVPLGE
jgi:GH15 family glucan-1,4-alpha-glucosidase